jgi:HSP20 family protein
MKLSTWRNRGLSRPADFFGGIDRDFGGLLSSFFSGSSLEPSLDIKETKDELVVTADLPGMEKKDIHVEVENGMLSISGERHEEKEGGEGEWRHSERSWGSFSRSVSLPAHVKEDKVKAEYKDGVLKIHLAKDEAKSPKTITIN